MSEDIELIAITTLGANGPRPTKRTHRIEYTYKGIPKCRYKSGKDPLAVYNWFLEWAETHDHEAYEQKRSK